MSHCLPEKIAGEGVVEIVTDLGEGDIHEQECCYRKEKYERPLVHLVFIWDGQYPGRKEQYHQDK